VPTSRRVGTALRAFAHLTLAAAADKVSPIVRHRASIAQQKVMGFATLNPSYGLHRCKALAFESARGMMVCYLDDSGTDAASPILTMAGYVGLRPMWAAFEQSASKIFAEFGITTLHGKEFNDTKGQFKGWSRKKKEAFIARLIVELKKAALFGVMASISKTAFAKAKDLGEHEQQSPYGFCFGEILDQIMFSAVMKAAASNGATLSFVVEAGNKNDADVVRVFNKAKADPRNAGAELVLRSVEFANKTSTIALQMADFLAFTGRRYAAQSEGAKKYLPMTDLQKVAFFAIPTAASLSHTFLSNAEIETGDKDPKVWREASPWLDKPPVKGHKRKRRKRA
jgi:hypothetical protein